MCSAIHINSRSWLRSSSTHEPSDPPLKVVTTFSLVSWPSTHAEVRGRVCTKKNGQRKEPKAKSNSKTAGCAGRRGNLRARKPPLFEPSRPAHAGARKVPGHTENRGGLPRGKLFEPLGCGPGESNLSRHRGPAWTPRLTRLGTPKRGDRFAGTARRFVRTARRPTGT